MCSHCTPLYLSILILASCAGKTSSSIEGLWRTILKSWYGFADRKCVGRYKATESAYVHSYRQGARPASKGRPLFGGAGFFSHCFLSWVVNEHANWWQFHWWVLWCGDLSTKIWNQTMNSLKIVQPTRDGNNSLSVLALANDQWPEGKNLGTRGLASGLEETTTLTFLAFSLDLSQSRNCSYCRQIWQNSLTRSNAKAHQTDPPSLWPISRGPCHDRIHNSLRNLQKSHDNWNQLPGKHRDEREKQGRK